MTEPKQCGALTYAGKPGELLVRCCLPDDGHTQHSEHPKGVQWGAAQTADTGTRQTDAGPTPMAQMANSACADAVKGMADMLSQPNPVPDFKPTSLRDLFERPVTDPPPQPPRVGVDIAKHGYLVMYSHEQMQTFKLEDPEDTAANRKAAREARERELAEQDALLATAHPSLQPIIKLHHRDADEECQGCDIGAWGESGADWPCSTIDLILEELAKPAGVPACPTRLMDGRNEIRCWLPAGHTGECK